MYRADAALELLLTEDGDRATAVAEELDRINGERRHAEQRILFEAEAQVRELGDRRAYVLWGEGWHKGVIGIVASRIAERHHRPVVLVALDGETGTGSGRSIPAFDLLGGLEACRGHLLRHGGHRAAAGCEVAATAAAGVPRRLRGPRRGGAERRRARSRASGSTPSWPATSSVSRWPRSSSCSSRLAWATRSSGCSCPAHA